MKQILKNYNKNMTNNSFYIKNFISKNIFNWTDFKSLMKDHPINFIETINELNEKDFIKNKKSLKNKSVIISNTINVKKEFLYLINFFKLKIPILNNSNENDVHIYASFSKKSKSFKSHKDSSYTFILQTEGKSRWIVKNMFDIILEPNDLIYIPKMVEHECIPMGKRISLSFPFWGC